MKALTVAALLIFSSCLLPRQGVAQSVPLVIQQNAASYMPTIVYSPLVSPLMHYVPSVTVTPGQATIGTEHENTGSDSMPKAAEQLQVLTRSAMQGLTPNWQSITQDSQGKRLHHTRYMAGSNAASPVPAKATVSAPASR